MRAAACALKGKSGHEAGRELLQKLYMMETGLPLPEIRTAPRGKPYFPGSPLHFSISHTKSHAFCVLARCPVGIDAEELDRPVPPSLAARVLSPAEAERYSCAEDPRLAFLAMWVLKEASAKLSGEGLKGFPDQTDFSPNDPRVHRWQDCLVAILAAGPEEGVTYHAF